MVANEWAQHLECLIRPAFIEQRPGLGGAGIGRQRAFGRRWRLNREQEKGGSSQRAAKAFEGRRHAGGCLLGEKRNGSRDYIRADNAGTKLSPIRNPASCSGKRPSCDSRTGRKFHAHGVTESRHRLHVRFTPPRQHPQLEARRFRLLPAAQETRSRREKWSASIGSRAPRTGQRRARASAHRP